MCMYTPEYEIAHSFAQHLLCANCICEQTKQQLGQTVVVYTFLISGLGEAEAGESSNFKLAWKPTLPSKQQQQ